VSTASGNKLTPAALLGVLGIVYGDIGTSPLYALKAALLHFDGGGIEAWEILGIISLIFWALMLTVTVKYVLFVMRADNRGEGGIMALMALAQRTAETHRGKMVIGMIGIVGASLFLGDGMITPAISVLSAIEGLEVINPVFKVAVLPLTIGVLLALFLVQHRGTGSIGKLFGPVCALWFGTIGLLGLIEALRFPAVFAAVSPWYAINFCLHYHLAAFIAMGSVVLAVTGAEALYADMGHFGRRPIQLAWVAFVLPALALNYMGQGALLLRDPAAIENPFFLLAPEWFRPFLVILATAATIIASQSMISGAFSIARQCVQMGFSPRLVVRHTSATAEGQIYMPQVNYILLIGVLILVLEFRSSEALAAAYGLAVTGTFLCTTVLAFLVFRRQFNGAGCRCCWSSCRCSCSTSPISSPPRSRSRGRLRADHHRRRRLHADVRLVARPPAAVRPHPPGRAAAEVLPGAAAAVAHHARAGIAVFMTGQADYLPGALLHNLKHNKVLHENVLFVTVLNEDIPRSAPSAASR
jgi:KUP system potassium uptake protein